jgi:hypothetical protein
MQNVALSPRPSFGAVSAGVVLLASACLAGGCRTMVDFAAIQDGQTAARVKTALVNDRALGTALVEVRVEAGVAYLTGTVRSQEEVDHAVALASDVPGVTRVETNLRVDGTASPDTLAPPAPPSDDISESPGDRRLLAVGVSLGWSEPRGGLRGGGMGVGPLIRLGSGRGLGPSLALGWYRVSLPETAEGASRSRIRVRPLMAGVGYTFASDRLSFAPSLVAGWSFNDVTVLATSGQVGRLVVGVGNSFVWRPGVSMWIDANRRVAVNLSGGYAVTRMPITFLENGQLLQSHLRADTTILHAGVAYKLF